MLKHLGVLSALALMDGLPFNPSEEKRRNLPIEDISGIPIQTKPANGCKEYWFTDDGRYHNGNNNHERITKAETVYYCHASNDRNAIRKFNNFKSKKIGDGRCDF